jgi:glyoxylase-like metal-dependent hydrolase (beta-lactamase superfamily II)
MIMLPWRNPEMYLTHSDFDHAGGLALFANAEIYLSSDEQPMISG